VSPPKYSDHPFEEENWSRFYTVDPVKDQDKLKISWTIDNMEIHYENDPSSYFSHLIGHEGKCSLLSVLIDEVIYFDY
jgi:insulysin